MKPQVAIVTGGAQGMGFGIARDLAERGLHVVIADVNDRKAEESAESLRNNGYSATGIGADVTSRESVETLFTAAEQLGTIEVLVNNAGISVDIGIRRITDEVWDRTIAVNLTGVMLCTQAAARSMAPRQRGQILNISSRAWLGWWGQLPYSASKGGVVSATRASAIELARFGITVNCIAPGLIDTPLLRAEPQEVMDRLLAAQPTGSIGTADDVAWAARYFTSEMSRSTTGQVLYVCGGKSLYAQPA